MLETGFAVSAFIALFLNLLLQEEIDEEKTKEITANTVDNEADEEEWRRIKHAKEMESRNSGSEDVKAV